MTWRDELYNNGLGSFRGVSFYVQGVGSTFGRTTIMRQFPAKDLPIMEDIGRAPRTFAMSCFVLGENYNVDRDLLIAEFEKAGPGQLVHPYLGEFKVVINGPVTLNETYDEGNVARFDIQVVVVGDEALTISAPDLVDIVDVSADTAAEAAGAEFESTFSVINAINSVRQAAVSTVSSVTQELAAARAVVNSTLAVVDDVGSAVQSLVSTAAQLILAPVNLVNSVRGVIAGAFAAISTLSSAVSTLIDIGGLLTAPIKSSLFGDVRGGQANNLINTMANSGSTLPNVTDPSTQGTQSSKNQKAIVKLYRTLGVIEGARAISKLGLESRDTVTSLSDTVSDLIDQVSTDAGDDLYGALQDLRQSFLTQMGAIAQELPSLIDYIPPEPRPALCIAYDIHKDATRSTEIVVRNGINDPNAVPGLIAIKVVVDV